MSLCIICCNTIKAKTKFTKCVYCDFSCCKECVCQYILSQTGKNAKCMSCNKEYTRNDLLAITKRGFVDKEYKVHRQKIFYEREKSLLPDTQPLIQVEIMVRKLRIDNSALWKELKVIRTNLNTVMNNNFNIYYTRLKLERVYIREATDENKAKIDALAKEYEISKKEVTQLKEIRKQLITAHSLNQHQYNRMTLALRRGEIPPDIEETNIDKKTKRVFIKPCPVNECRGFLNTAYKCGTCETNVCPKCHEILKEDHVCKPDDIESAKLIMKETRSCPKCAVPIFKIDGCDQMWCSMCKTAFSWKSGDIINGRIHNPHYYEWMRSEGKLQREVGDVPCGGLPDIRSVITWLNNNSLIQPTETAQVLRRLVRTPINYESSMTHVIFAIHRLIGHITDIELPKYRINVYYNNCDLRILFLMKEITEFRFMKIIQQREKHNDKKTEIFQVLEMFVNISNDIFRNYVLSTDLKPLDLVDEIERLRLYTNECLEKIKDCYKCIIPNINRLFEAHYI